jgi:acyl-coenzyme A thioesterase PaaI-like protein
LSETPTKLPKSAAPFNNLAQVEIYSGAPGTGLTRLPDVLEVKNHLDTVHAGALFTAGEISAARAVVTMLGEDIAKLVALTRRAEIRYLKPARGAIEARATLRATREDIFREVAANGRTRASVEVKLTDTAGVIVAEMDVDCHIARPKD